MSLGDLTSNKYAFMVLGVAVGFAAAKLHTMWMAPAAPGAPAAPAAAPPPRS